MKLMMLDDGKISLLSNQKNKIDSLSIKIRKEVATSYSFKGNVYETE